MQNEIDFIIEDYIDEEVVCNIDIEELDVAKIPLVEGGSNEYNR